MPENLPAPGASPARVLYQIAGEGSEHHSVIALRDRIRNGNLQPEDQVAIAGTDLWRPAAEHAPLARYFSLLKPAAGAAVAAPQAPAGPMSGRAMAGLIYPFTGVLPVVFIIVGFAAAIGRPGFAIIVNLLTTVYAMSVIRKSSEGQTTAPSMGETGGAGEWVMGLLRLIAVSLISAWPIILVLVLAMVGLARSLWMFAAAMIVMVLYYPASLATVAIWKSIKSALSVQQIFRFIGILGGDYYAVVGIFMAFAIAIGVVTGLAGRVPGMRAVNTAASLWLTIYASHLLGWAVHRHRDALQGS